MQVDGHWNRLRVWRNQLDIFCCKPCDWRAGQGGPSHQCDGGRTEHTDQHPDKEARDTRSEGEIPHQASNRYGKRGSCSPRKYYFRSKISISIFFFNFMVIILILIHLIDRLAVFVCLKQIQDQMPSPCAQPQWNRKITSSSMEQKFGSQTLNMQGFS